EMNALKDQVNSFEQLESEIDDIEIMYELLQEEEDEQIKAEIESSLHPLEQRTEDFELQLLLSEPFDKNNAILELHPGAGGTESQDWASILLRMYQRWADSKGFQVETLNYLAGDEAGVKNVSLLIKGH